MAPKKEAKTTRPPKKTAKGKAASEAVEAQMQQMSLRATQKYEQSEAEQLAAIERQSVPPEQRLFNEERGSEGEATSPEGRRLRTIRKSAASQERVEEDQASPARRRSKSKTPSRRRERESSVFLTPGHDGIVDTFDPTHPDWEAGDDERDDDEMVAARDSKMRRDAKEHRTVAEEAANNHEQIANLLAEVLKTSDETAKLEKLKKIVALDSSMSDTFQDEIARLTTNQSTHDAREEKRLRMLKATGDARGVPVFDMVIATMAEMGGLGVTHYRRMYGLNDESRCRLFAAHALYSNPALLSDLMRFILEPGTLPIHKMTDVDNRMKALLSSDSPYRPGKYATAIQKLREELDTDEAVNVESWLQEVRQVWVYLLGLYVGITFKGWALNLHEFYVFVTASDTHSLSARSSTLEEIRDVALRVDPSPVSRHMEDYLPSCEMDLPVGENGDKFINATQWRDHKMAYRRGLTTPGLLSSQSSGIGTIPPSFGLSSVSQAGQSTPFSPLPSNRGTTSVAASAAPSGSRPASTGVLGPSPGLPPWGQASTAQRRTGAANRCRNCGHQASGGHGPGPGGKGCAKYHENPLLGAGFKDPLFFAYACERGDMKPLEDKYKR